MNRIIATTGAAVLGAVAVQPAQAQDAKPWNVTASVRSFYDDNYTTSPSKAPAPGSPTKRSSWGLELSPSGSYKLDWGQSSLNLNSRYGMRYYEDRTSGSADHSFDFGADFTHRFTEKQSLTVTDSFAVAQEPGVLDPGLVSTFSRTDGSNIRNNFQLKYAWDDIIERWSGEVSYANTFYDYQEDNSSKGGVGSRSALLDRAEHLFTIAGRYRIFDETGTELLMGYSLGLTDSTSKDFIIGTVLPESRDTRSHYFFTGVSHKFTPELKVNGRVGLQYVEYPNAASADAALAALVPASPAFQRSQVSPYVDANGTWDYLPNSSLQLGVRVTRITTDISTSVDAAATTVYGSLNHEFLPDLKGSLLAQFQHSEYRGTTDTADNLFTTGLNVEWKFHQFWSMEAGYNYDRLDSDLAGRSYYRNRVYLGFRASY